MQPIDYKTISPTWIVEQGDGDNVLRPAYDESQPDRNMCETMCNVWDYTLLCREHTYPTSLQPGTYKAEELPDAVWQYRRRGYPTWSYAYLGDYDRYKTFKDFAAHLGRYYHEARLYVATKL